MDNFRIGFVALGIWSGITWAGAVQATPLQDQIKMAITLCAPFAEDEGLPDLAGDPADEVFQQALSQRYGSPPDPNLRSLQGLPLAVLTQGVKGCWMFGTHTGHMDVIAAAEELASSNVRVRLIDRYDYGVSLDGLNAEMGVTLRSRDPELGRVEVSVGTFGPAQNGFFEINVSRP